MKKKAEIIGLCIGWFAVIMQFFLMYQKSQTSALEMVIRFFSFFTILTNILVALYFTAAAFKTKFTSLKWILVKGALTAVTTFILIVGLVYQVALRKLWSPTGLQYIVDELLHTIVPLFMLLYWFFNIKKEDLQLKSIISWLLYPILYIIFILLRGNFSGYYPYPFLDVNKIGFEKTVLNITIVIGITFLLIMILLTIGKIAIKKQTKN